MSDENDKPKTTGRIYSDTPLFQTAAEATGMKAPTTLPTPGLSQSPGLEKIEGSTVPGLAHGGTINHVKGPQQAPVDPIAAGLDLGHNPQTRNENRAVTQTGEIAAGTRPSTYGHPASVPQAAPADGSLVAGPDDTAGKPPAGEPNKVDDADHHDDPPHEG